MQTTIGQISLCIHIVLSVPYVVCFLDRTRISVRRVCLSGNKAKMNVHYNNTPMQYTAIF